MDILQKLYCLILNPIYGKTATISFEKRNRIVFILMFLLYGSILVWYSINMFGVYFSHSPRMVFEAFLFLIMILFMSDKKLALIKWNKPMALSWILCGIIIFVMGFYAEQNFGYWLIGPVMAFCFPCLYFIILNQKNYGRYLNIFCKAIVVVSILYFLFAVFAEYFGILTANLYLPRYQGTTSDANRLGEICVATFVCSIYGFTSKSFDKAWKIVSALSMIFCMCNAWLSVSRSTLLAIGCMIVFFIIISMKEAIGNRDWKHCCIRMICLTLCFVIAFLGTVMMEKLHQHVIETLYVIAVETGGESESLVDGRVELSGQDLDMYSSGRITIWTTYLSKTGILGNPADGKTPIDPSVLVNVAAHNTLLEFSYRSGLAAGLLFFIVEVISGIFILRVLCRKSGKNEDKDYLTAFAAIGFITVSNLQVAYNPLTSIIFFVYAVFIAPLFGKDSRKEQP